MAPAAPHAPELADSKVDVKEFQLAWSEMSDVHQFNRLLGEFRLTRDQAMRLAPAGAARAIKPPAVRTLLDESARQQLGVMAFLGNRGVTQIFSGKIVKIVAAGAGSTCSTRIQPAPARQRVQDGLGGQARGRDVDRVFDGDDELVVTFFGVASAASLNRRRGRT